MRSEMTPRDLQVQHKNSNGRTIHQDPSRQNQAIENDRGPLDAQRSYRDKPAFATEGVRARTAQPKHNTSPSRMMAAGRRNSRRATRLRLAQLSQPSDDPAIAERQSSKPRTQAGRTAQLSQKATHGTASRKPYPLRRVRFALRRVK